MLFVVSAVLFDMLKARQLACVSKSGQKCPAALSLSSWRAWIEMLLATRPSYPTSSRSPHGERGLKSKHRESRRLLCRRSPHGERGLKFRINRHGQMPIWSLSSWRAWIEMDIAGRLFQCRVGRSPHGERGLKWHVRFQGAVEDRSLSSWRAWIEIDSRTSKESRTTSRSPHGERGLKLYVAGNTVSFRSRSPHGERGLK